MRGSFSITFLTIACMGVSSGYAQQPVTVPIPDPGPLLAPAEVPVKGGKALDPVDVIPVPHSPGTITTPARPQLYQVPGNVTYPLPKGTHSKSGMVYSQPVPGGCQSGQRTHGRPGLFGWFKRSHSSHTVTSSGSRSWFRSSGSCCGQQQSRGLFGWWRR
ncbi:MAG: hypothetical protein ACFCD0_15120 [Gemmataceae bacterium]